MLSKSGLLNVYWAVLAITAVFSVLFKDDRKRFVTATAIVHIFVCGFRYDSMHGDLIAYKKGFNSLANADWLSDTIISNGRNTLFQALNKLIANLTNNNFQTLLFVIASISIISISIVIYKYSANPFISYFMWNCFGFYIFGFYSIKQSLAMAFVMFAAIGLFERKRWMFYLFSVIAGFVHMPAFVYLPAYELCRAKKLRTIVVFYALLTGVVIIFRNQIVNQITDLYYENERYAMVSSFGIGGKSLMLIALTGIGIFLCNYKNEVFRYTLIMVATASLIQMFSVYNNVFTRLADYYFQFIILYAPFILSQPYKGIDDAPLIPFNEESRNLIAVLFCLLAMVFYYRVNFLNASPVPVDNLVINYKFFWQ